MTVHLAAVGDATDPAVWSGTPFHMLEAGLRLGAPMAGLPLKPGKCHQLEAIGWSLVEMLKGRGAGGYQFSQRFLGTLWSGPAGAIRARDTVISLFQLMPREVAFRKDIIKVFYVDQTLRQLFDHYPETTHISQAHREDFIAAEREQYLAADAVIGHCRWCVNSLIKDYRVPEGKVSFVLPGANISGAAYQEWERGARPRPYNVSGPLRLVFVGKDGKRKGLDLLLQSLRLCEQWDRIELTIIGCAQTKELANLSRPTVRWLGHIDKSADGARFLEAVSSSDIGVLLSRAEAGGISLREFHALGLATLTKKVGGCPEMVDMEASIVVEEDISVPQLAGLLDELARDPVRVNALKERSWAGRRKNLWDQAVKRLVSATDKLS